MYWRRPALDHQECYDPRVLRAGGQTVRLCCETDTSSGLTQSSGLLKISNSGVLFTPPLGGSGEWSPILSECFQQWTYWCCEACLLFCNVALFRSFYVCTAHILIVCMNGPVAKMEYCLHPLWVFFGRVGPDFKWVLPVADILMLWWIIYIYVVLLRKKAAPHNIVIRFLLFLCVLCTVWCFVWFLHEMVLLQHEN